MNNWNKVFKPIVVLCVICLVITGALAATNSVTAPIIEEATIRAQNEARQELVPQAASFTKVEGIEVEHVSDVYQADTGEYVITCDSKGYDGTVTVMVAITADGTIKQLKVTEQSETKGMGSRVVDTPSYWTRYEGLAAQPLTLNVDVDAETGATVSSRALLNAVNAAIAAYNAIS